MITGELALLGNLTRSGSYSTEESITRQKIQQLLFFISFCVNSLYFLKIPLPFMQNLGIA